MYKQLKSEAEGYYNAMSRDIKYLDSIYETLVEGKGIRTTKLKPYYDRATSYRSQRHPNTNHSEMTGIRRRGAMYDYGNAEYTEISAQDALQLVRQDKHNIEKLRIIYRLNDPASLVEYEVRENGSIYAIYGSADEVTIGDKTYKNIRYAPWKQVINNADLIYVTDEYDHEISAEQQRQRNLKSQAVVLTNPVAPDSAQYDAHRPASMMYDGSDDTHRVGFRQFDTGAHTNAVQLATDPAHRQYLQARRDADTTYERLDQYRRAIKKVKAEIERVQESDPEYAELLQSRLQQWSRKYEEAMTAYNTAQRRLKSAKAAIEQRMDDRVAEFQERIKRDLEQYESLLTQGHRRSEELNRLISTTSMSSSKWSRLSTMHTRLTRQLRELDAAQSRLDSVVAAGFGEIDIEQLSVNAAYEDVYQIIAELEDEQRRQIEETTRRADAVRETLAEIDEQIAGLRPHQAAERAVRAAKNKASELDPQLVDIIQFVDD